MFDWDKKNDKNSQLQHEDPADQELARRMAQYGDGNTLDPRKALEHILHVGFYRGFQTPEVVEGDHVLLPAWRRRSPGRGALPPSPSGRCPP